MDLLLIPMTISVFFLGMGLGALLENRRLWSARTEQEVEELQAQTRTTLVNLARVESQLRTASERLGTLELEVLPEITQELPRHEQDNT